MGSLVMRMLREYVPGVAEGKLSRDGRMLRWVEVGSGSPAVIMDAGLGELGTMAWAAAMPKIAQQGQVIAYDRAGLGMSDPAPSLSLQTSVGDLTALAAHADPDGCILVGHSWSGLLAQIVALQTPERVAGLVLVDPAEETYWQSLPPEIRRQSYDLADELLARYARGDHGDMIRQSCERTAKLLTDDPQAQARILDAYVECYSTPSQVEALPAEIRLFDDSIAEVTRIRAAGPLPDVPLVVLSATEGAREDHRAAWTSLHAKLAASVPRGQHIVLSDTDHAINEVRPEAIVAAVEAVRSALRSG